MFTTGTNDGLLRFVEQIENQYNTANPVANITENYRHWSDLCQLFDVSGSAF